VFASGIFLRCDPGSHFVFDRELAGHLGINMKQVEKTHLACKPIRVAVTNLSGKERRE